VKRSIGFFAPSGALPDPLVMDRAAARLADLGWQVSAGESVFAREQRFAGSDELRLAELQRFATDPLLDVAAAARGGYGLTRLLDRIDFAAIARRAPVIVGYSDFTAFSLAYLAQARGVSFQGPAVTDFAREEGSGLQAADFLRAVEETEQELRFPTGAQPLSVRGRLWGGNLSMIASLMGTPYFPKVAGGILFLEDVNEPAYRIERLLLQLFHAGVLARQKAVLLGDFTGMQDSPHDHGYGLAQAIAHVKGRCEVPFVDGLPFGHGERRAALAVGAPAILEVGEGEARLVMRALPSVRARG